MVIFLAVLLTYVAKTYQQKKLKSSTANQMTRYTPLAMATESHLSLGDTRTP